MSPTRIALLLCLGFALCFSFVHCDVIRFEAEKAHLTGGFTHLHPTEAHAEFVANSEKLGRALFTVNIPADGIYGLKLRYQSAGGSQMSLQANGHRLKVSSFASTASVWSEQLEELQLRTGVNTVVVEARELAANFMLDFVEVHGAIPLAVRGATLPYVEIEAEAAQNNGGSVIGPDRSYYNLPSEASGRQAVQLSDSSQNIVFTLTSQTNAMSVRYSIPDSGDGQGLSATLQVQVQNGPSYNLSLTSHWSWVYGNYPFTKNPGDGLPHHFYDEVRAFFGQAFNSGTTITLINLTPGITVTVDLADFYMAPDPYSEPNDNSINVNDYGADPTGQSDSTGAFANAINDCKNQGRNLWIPIGNYGVTTLFQPNNMVVRGAGPWYTTVFATVPGGVGFFGDWSPNPSENVELYDFRILGGTNVRNDGAVDSGSGGALDGSSVIQNVWIEHTKCGMWFDGPFSGLHINGVIIRNTFADGVNLHVGISNVVIEQSMIRNTGDDGLAMWSQNQPDQNNVLQFNTIQSPLLANAIAIYGGSDNSATDNYVSDSVCEGGGLQASNRFGAVALAGTTTFARNTVVRCGAPNHDNSAHNGAIWFWSNDEPQNGQINVVDSQVYDSSYSGVLFWGTTTTNVNFQNVLFDTAPYAIEVQGLSGSASFNNVTATNMANAGIYSCDTAFQLSISNSNGLDTTQC